MGFKSLKFLQKKLGVTSWYQSHSLRELGILVDVLDSNLRLYKSLFSFFKYFSNFLKTSSERCRDVPVSQPSKPYFLC